MPRVTKALKKLSKIFMSLVGLWYFKLSLVFFSCFAFQCPLIVWKTSPILSRRIRLRLKCQILTKIPRHYHITLRQQPLIVCYNRLDIGLFYARRFWPTIYATLTQKGSHRVSFKCFSSLQWYCPVQFTPLIPSYDSNISYSSVTTLTNLTNLYLTSLTAVLRYCVRYL